MENKLKVYHNPEKFSIDSKDVHVASSWVTAGSGEFGVTHYLIRDRYRGITFQVDISDYPEALINRWKEGENGS